MKTWITSAGNKIIRVVGGRSNVFLLTNGITNILIDTSPAFMWKTLQGRLKRLGIEQLELLILTHSHFDHAANAARIQERFKAKVIVHESESGYLSAGDNLIPAGTNPFTGFLMATFAEKLRSYARYQPCIPDITFEDKFSLTEYGFNAYLLHTPGHTKGSVSLIVDDEIAIVGDTMFGVFPSSVFPPFANDVDQMLDSWKMLLSTKCRLFLPAHGSMDSRKLVEKDYAKRTSR